jgi:tetratricopeptide (TPR) repeat protein
MRTSRNKHWLPIIFLACLAPGAVAADRGAISGIVRDEAGKPLGGVRITLTATQGAQTAFQTSTSPSGEYRFTGLASGEYKLSASLADYSFAAPLMVRIATADVAAAADLILTRDSSASSSVAEPAHSPVQFEAAGIRGLIDPGGYSASTDGAASGLLRGIADIRRTDRSFSISAAKEWPCNLEPELRRAVAEQPDQADANRRLGQFYVAHEQPAKAIPLLKRALQIDSGDYAASRQLAVALLQSGDFESARKTLTSPAEQHSDPELHQLLARADEGSGMFLQAAQEYRSANDEEPSEESLFGMGYELILAGSVADGIAAFETGVREYPRSIPLRIGAGTALFLSGKTSAGLHLLLDATDIDPDDPRPYSFLAGASAASNEESDRVRSSFKRFLDHNPGSANANYYFALALLRAPSPDGTDRIEALLKRAVQIDPNLAQAHLQLGEIYAQRDDYEDAVPEFEAAVRLDQNLGEAHYRLSMAYRHTGRTQQAAREMEIFRLSKAGDAGGSGAQGIDLSQFISVMGDPNQHIAQETECPASPH